MIEHWNYKKNRSSGMSNPDIDLLYDLGMSNGALGGKLIGAGGGGFIMFYAKDKNKLRQVMRDNKIDEVRFKFDYDGTKVILRS